jgi:hypothetical protein
MDDTPKEKAPKHPLAALPPSTIPIDEWKRQYSNNETDVALKWFWEHYDPKEFSLWRVDYKVLYIPSPVFYPRTPSLSSSLLTCLLPPCRPPYHHPTNSSLLYFLASHLTSVFSTPKTSA